MCENWMAQSAVLKLKRKERGLKMVAIDIHPKEIDHVT